MASVNKATARLVAGLDTSRRVGWAKWYAECDDHQLDRHLGFHRLGMMLGILERANQTKLPRSATYELIQLLVEKSITEAEDRQAVANGHFDAGVLVRSRWGDIGQALSEVLSARLVRSKRVAVPGEVRCSACRKMIARLVAKRYEVRCGRCGVTNDIAHRDGGIS